MPSTFSPQPDRSHVLPSWFWLAAFALALMVGDVHAQTEPPTELVVVRFDIFEFRVEGNTVLPTERIERAVAPYLGEKRTVADVELARRALETAYRDAGFGTVLVDTPKQRVNAGVVTLQVVQAQVSRLRVIGAKYYSQGRILEKVPSLAEGEVANFKSVSEQLASVNRSADRRVTPLLRPGKLPGTTEVDLTVEDQAPVHGSLELNDKYSANTTRTRLQASLRYDNLWQLEHSLGVQVQVSPQDTHEVRVLSGSYTAPMGTGLLILSAIRSNSNTVAGVGETTVFGRGSIYGLRRLWLDANEARSHTVTLGADYKHFSEDVNVGADQGFSTPIRYLPLSAGYAATVFDKQGFWQAGTGVVMALRGLASDQSEFDNKRFLGQNNFSIFKFDLARTQALPQGLSLFGKIEGQVSSQPLISNEQFVAGGVDSVRGYLEATAVGDQGLRASFELRSPNFVADSPGVLADLRAHAFFEGAGLWLKSPLPKQDARSGLLSTGFGLRLRASRYASLALDLGWALHDAGQTEKGSARLHASGMLEF